MASQASTRKASDRRSELLAAAASVFARKGIAHTTVRDIAEVGGILSGSLYHHFVSKDQIVVEVLEGGLRESAARDIAIVDAAPGPVEAIRQLIVSFVIWVGEQPEVARILANDRQYIRDTPGLIDVEIDRQKNRLLWEDVVRDGVDKGLFSSSINTEVVVRAIFDGALASVRWLPPVGTAEPGEIGAQLAEFYLNGLIGPAPSA